MISKKIITSSIIILTLIAAPLSSQETDAEETPVPADEELQNKEYYIGDVVVSATRTEIFQRQVSRSISVLNSEDIEASPREYVEDIVRDTPGVHNFRHSGLNTNGIVSPLIMRGVGKNRTLLLVDGVPQNDNFNNAIAWVGWGHIPKESIERIEIVRGPSSALYGPEGLGGVIHIITKDPQPERESSVRGEAGSGKSFAGHGYYNQQFNNSGFMLAGGYEQSDGFYMTENPEDHAEKRYREMGRGMGKITYDIGDRSRVSFSVLYYDYDGGQGFKYRSNELQLDQYRMNYNYNGDGFAVNVLLYLNRADKTAYKDKNETLPSHEEKLKGTHTRGADLQAVLMQWNNASITIGGAYKQAVWKYNEDYFESTRDAGAEGKQRTVSPFANLDMRFLEERLILNLGTRYDRIETYDGMNYDTTGGPVDPYDNTYRRSTDTNISPSAGIVFHPDERTTLRASGGKGFRAPSLFELYKVHVRGGGSYYRHANPELGPEKIWSWDVGAERFLRDNLWTKITFYQSFAGDYIGDRFLETDSGTDYYELDNISKVDIHGIEAELVWQATDKLMFSANYTWNISRVAEDTENPELEGNYLTNDPRHSLHTGIAYINPDIINITLLTNYYSTIYYDNENTLKTDYYWTADLALSRIIKDRLKIYLNAENIFDKKYAIFKRMRGGQLNENTAPGLLLTGGIKYEF